MSRRPQRLAVALLAAAGIAFAGASPAGAVSADAVSTGVSPTGVVSANASPDDAEPAGTKSAGTQSAGTKPVGAQPAATQPAATSTDSAEPNGASPTGAGPGAAACGAKCDQQDPRTFNMCGSACQDGIPQRCADDAVTRHTSERGWVELRYSVACRTVWSRTAVGFPGMRGEHWVETRYSNGVLRMATTPTSDAWSPMLNDAGLAGRACAATLDVHYERTATECTGWY
ncbi:DUF2690 domain-containing protein [Actinoplanes teichomyceticus]|uniref:Uncharacterized protein DUF2690 n=1 Tax=Actinoplanes teichomyceticus TaxID=1867 RepID=A0A561VC94_ACTTI|nr:DUF2690 domain-containing protein [Actinoplanes teichomyceticus]TWG09197.1 uncharacterized protein DUF2690 [Actinoplanes teichomyceticus]GIF14053.1 hypothetical protein Ate01nite_40850 [Actinoplanes teichomyceticus]